MSVTSFGRSLRSRRPSAHDVYRRLRHDRCLNGHLADPIAPSRSFSSTPSLAVGSKQQVRERHIVKTPLPFFPPTQNAALDAYLTTLHRDQFTLDHLPDQYRRLITRKKRHHVLAEQAAQQAFAQGTNPATTVLTVTIDDQTIPLRPVQKRVLYSARTLTKVLALLRSPTEYDVLPTLVAAMAYSKMHITSAQWARLIFHCGGAGRPGVALRIAQDGIIHRRNEFTYTRASLREMMRAQFVRFLLPDVKDAEKAAQRARSVVTLARGWKKQFDAEQMRRRLDDRAPDWLSVDPVVIGSLLFLQAGKAMRWQDGKVSQESGSAMLKDARALMACWEGLAKLELGQINAEIEAAKAAGVKTTAERPAYALARAAVKDWEPVLQGLEWSATVLQRSGVKDVEVERWLPLATGLLANAIKQWRPVAMQKGGARIGMQLYEGAYEDLDDWYVRDVERKPADVVKDVIAPEPEKERHPGH